MRKTLWKVGLTTAAVVLLSSSSAYAQPATASAGLSVTVNVGSRARLTLGAAGITFGDADPIVTPTMTSGPVTVNVGARTTSGANVTLTLVATQDLTSGSNTIPITDLSWSVAGDAGLIAGAAAVGIAQNVGSWTGSGLRTGTQTFSLPNSWTYVPGTYLSQLNYTLTVP